MLLKIASRKSDLARLQAYLVAQALQDNSSVTIEHLFSASYGDNNPNLPLHQMPAKGVFTQDFSQGLAQGTFDLVVHSWKDLPVELPSTSRLFTMPRADARDVLLCKKACLDAIERHKKLDVLTSSPRRSHHLKQFIPHYFPLKLAEEHVHCHEVRGNIPTRLAKLIDGPHHALVVAKAALDRLLSSPLAEFASVQQQLRHHLDQCHLMVLPLSEFPTAAAQGALGLEVHRDRQDVIELLEQIHCPQTFQHVRRERQTLQQYGGGCHQKIGMTSRPHRHGHFFSVSGVTPDGTPLKTLEFLPHSSTPSASKRDHSVSKDDLYPLIKSEQDRSPTFFKRKPLAIDLPPVKHLFVTKETALPSAWDHQLNDKVLWCSGLTTWKKLAQRGIWVHGSCESLGESDGLDVEQLLHRGRPIKWTKLTHKTSTSQASPHTPLATYELQLKPQEERPDLSHKKYYYWMSASQFKAALDHCPTLLQASHACGPGLTYDEISRQVPENNPVQVYLSYEQWYENLTKQSL